MAITEVVLGSLIAIVVTLIFDYKRLRDQRNRLREALLTEIDIIDSDLNWIWDNVQIYNDFGRFIEGDRELTYEYYPEGKEDYIQYFSDNPDRIEIIPDLTRKRIESVMESHPIFDNNLSVINILNKEEMSVIVRFYRTLTRFSDSSDFSDMRNHRGWILVAQDRSKDAQTVLS